MFPIAGLRLLLPALVPSWRFFDAVAASPRVEYALLPGPDAAARWQVFRPRPPVLSPGMMARRLLWNAQWNEDLFLVSLAERLIHSGDPAAMAHSQRELLLRVARHLERQGIGCPAAWLRIRVRMVDQVAARVAWECPPCALARLRGP